MKAQTVFLLTALMSLSAFAKVPAELENLVPTGSNNVTLHGKTEDQKDCHVRLDSYTDADSFTATIGVPDDDGTFDIRRFPTFQIALGHELEIVASDETILTAVSIHEAEEEYSNRSRSILVVSRKNSEIASIRIKYEQKGFIFGYQTKADETCYF
jgi:hypothetical protein